MEKVLVKQFYDETINEIIDDGFSEFEIDKFLPSCKTVVIKPNLSTHKAKIKNRVNTDIRLIESVIRYLNKFSDLKVFVVESENMGRPLGETFEIMNFSCLKNDLDFELVNLTNEEWKEINIDSGIFLKKVSLPKIILDADLIINMPKVKTHHCTTISCAMKNMFGLIPDPKRSIYHRNIHQTIADLNLFFQGKTFVITDGILAMEGQGPIHGRGVELNKVIFSKNNLVNDLVVSRIMGIPDNEIKHIKLANKKFEIKSEEIKVLCESGIFGVEKKFLKPKENFFSRFGCWAIQYPKLSAILNILARIYKPKNN